MRSPYDLFGIECAKGWMPLVAPVLAKARETGATVLQVKEKFGTLRIYLANASEELFKMAEDAEAKSATTCEECGAVGKLRDSGWLRTLCDPCERKRHAKH